MQINNNGQFIKMENDRLNGSKKAEANRGVEKKTTAQPSVDKVSAGDTLVLSPRVREIAEIAQQLKDSAEVREEKVNELRARIKDGTYHVDGLTIAGKIMDKAVNNI